MAQSSTGRSARIAMGQVWVDDPASAPSPPSEIPKYAALVVHGMGQQTKFETLDLLARGLAHAARGLRAGPWRARAVTLGEERLNRLEIVLESEGGKRELHLYEAYWAPLTEGQVTLRDVVYLAIRAIWNGIAVGLSDFHRWLFGRNQQFPTQLGTVAALLVGLAAVVALVIINTAIVVVAGARWALGAWETVITDGLYGDLSTAFNFVFVCLVAFGLVLGGARALRRASLALRIIVGFVSLVAFVLTLMLTIGVGLAIPILLYLHRQAVPTDTLPLMPAVFGLRRVDAFNSAVELVVIGLFLSVLLAGFLWLLVRLGWRLSRLLIEAPPRSGSNVAMLVIFFGLLALLVVEAGLLLLTDWGLPASGSAAMGRAGVWALLMVISVYVRRVVVQYVGDTAAYVQPHMLDRFDSLREKIKEDVRRKARAIYDAGGGREYEQVAVIGHSLGSVIAYDVLNRLINDDMLADGSKPNLHVATRTFLFLTVGSPLDKTAFVFGSQHRQSEVRHALAASAQPLIRGFHLRPARWVNIYSRWDPVSGPLDYYEPPRGKGEEPDPQAVKNERDPAALTLFFAHLEYFEGSLLFETLLDHLPAADTHARRLFDSRSCPHAAGPVAGGTGGRGEA